MVIEAIDIQKILPHRYPFFLVDRIIEIEPLKRAVGIKCVTFNEEFFQGHFPGNPVMPGVLILEAMAQVGGVSILIADENRGKLAFFAGMEKVKFRKPVIPGDQLVMETKILRLKGSVGKIWAEAKVDEQVVAEGEFLFVLSPAKQS